MYLSTRQVPVPVPSTTRLAFSVSFAFLTFMFAVFIAIHVTHDINMAFFSVRLSVQCWYCVKTNAHRQRALN